jgi:hypothetical protein
MIANINTLLSSLPPCRDEWVLIKEKQSVKDIIFEVLDAHKEFAPYYDNIALYFDGDTTEEICKNIYNFLKSNIRYEEEKEEDQTTALPAGLLSRGHGDCKHYASFSGGVLDSLNRLTGKKIKWNYRFASYDLFNTTPHHVFTVVHDDHNDREIWIDPTPGAAGKSPTWQIDKKIKVSPMALRRQIAGIGYAEKDSSDIVYVDVDQLPVNSNEQLNPVVVEIIEEQQADDEVTPELQNAIEILLHYGVMNDKAEVNDKQLQQLTLVLPQEEFDTVAQARELLNVYIQKDVAMGSFFSTLWRGVKKVTLALPRNAFLSLVALNAFGYATKLHNAIYNPDGTFSQPAQTKMYEKWNKVGGDWHNLRIAIESGAKKRALLGQVDFDGSSDVIGCCNRIGVAPAAAIPAWVAVASAIIAAIMPLVKELIRARQQAGTLPAGIDPNTGLPYGVNPGSYEPANNSFIDAIVNWVKENPIQAAGIGVGAYYFLTGQHKKRRA